MLVLPKLFVPDFSWSSSQSSFSTKLLQLPLLLSGVWCFCVQACGQDALWSPPVASTGNWNDAGNWTPGIPTGTATFDTANTTAVSLSGAITIGTLQFNGTAPAYSFNNLGTLEITGLGVVNQSLNNPVFTNTGPGEVISFNNGSSAGNALITNAGTGLGTIFLGTSTAGAATITTTAGGRVEFAGASTGGTARFINQATGIFDMSSVTSGAMTAGSIEGAGNFFLGSTSLTVGLNNLSATVSGPIEDGGLNGGSGASLIKVGAGTLTLTASNTYSGGTSFNGGVIAVQVDSNLGTGPITLNGGTLEILAAGGGITSNKPMIVLESGGNIQTDTGTTSTFSGAITGQGSLLGQNGFDKTGEGTLILSGVNTYSGFTNVQGGTLILGSSTALSPTGGLAVFGVVDLNGFNNTVAVLAGSGTITNNGPNAVNLTINPTSSQVPSTTFSGNIKDGNNAVELTVSGPASLRLSGNNTYSGGTNITAGASVSVTDGTNLGSGQITFDNGTLAVGSVLQTPTLNNALLLKAGGGVLDVTLLETLTVAGQITGPGALTVFGIGTTILSGVNTYQGGTNIQLGTLQVTSDTNMGTGPLSFDSGTLETLVGITSNKPVFLDTGGGSILTDTGTTSTLSGPITGPGSFSKDGPGTLILTAFNTYTGTTFVDTGTLVAGSSTAFSPYSAFRVSSVLDLNGFSNAIASLTGNGTVTNNGIATANLTVGLNNSNGLTTFNGNLSDGEGVLQLTKVGLSVQVLSGTNTYSGTTTVEGGVLQAGSTTAFSAASAFTVNGVLFLAGFSNTIGSLAGDGAVINNSVGNGSLIVIRRNAALGQTPATLTVGADNTSTVFSGIIIDGPSSLALTKIGLGTLTLTGANTYSGGTTISGGMLQLGDVGVGGSIVGGVVDNAVLSFAGSDTLTLDGAISGHGTVQQNGSGTTILSGSNTYSGPTIVAAGILEARSATAFSAASAFTVNAVLDLGGFSNTVGSLAGNGAVTNTGAGPATLSTGADNTSTLFSGALANGSSVLALNKVGLGTFILTGANTYTGGTTISGGALQLGAGGVSGSIVGDVVDNAVLIFAHSDRLPFNSAISGTGNVQQNGPGTTILTGLNTYTGGTLVNAGTLTVGGPQALGFGDVVVDGGILNADPQPINVRGNYIQNAGGTLQLAVTGADPGQYDSLVINGNASLAGRLELFSLGFVPEAGNSLTLVSTGGAVSGKFGTVLSPFKPGGGVNTIEVIYEPKAVLLAFLHLAGPTPPVLPPTPPGTPIPPGAPGTIVPISISLAQVSPEGLTAAFSIGFANAAIEMANLEDRLDALRAGCSGGFSSNMKLNGAPTNPGGKEVVDGKAAPTAPEPIAAAGCLKWRTWVTGSGDFVTVDNDANAQGYNFTTGSVTLGLDYRLTDHLAIGVMGEYSHTGTGLKPAGHMDVDSGRGGLYGTWYDHGLYVNGGIFAGHSTYDTSRSNTGGLSSGSTEGSEWSAFIGGGYDLHFRALSVGPIASLQYTSVNLDGFTERGSFLPLAIHSQSEESLRSDVGFRASYQCQIGKVMVRPAIKAAWEHEFKYSAFPITSSFADFSAPAVTFDGPKQGQDSAVVSAGVSAQLTSGVSVYVNYDGQLGRQNYSSNAVTGGFAISF